MAEVLESQVVFEGKVFNVRQDRVRLPNGHVARLDIVDHKGAVTLVPVDEAGNVWFIHQYRHPAEQVLLELPAGVMEAGEDPAVSAHREIREEIGMRAGKLEEIGRFYLAPGYSSEFMYVYLATELSDDPLPGDEDEDLKVEKIPLDRALRMAEEGQLQDVKSIAALFLARRHLGKP